MSKMHYFKNKFSKIAQRWWVLRLQRPLTFDLGDLKLRVIWPNCGFANWLWWNRT